MAEIDDQIVQAVSDEVTCLYYVAGYYYEMRVELEEDWSRFYFFGEPEPSMGGIRGQLLIVDVRADEVCIRPRLYVSDCETISSGAEVIDVSDPGEARISVVDPECFSKLEDAIVRSYADFIVGGGPR